MQVNGREAIEGPDGTSLERSWVEIARSSGSPRATLNQIDGGRGRPTAFDGPGRDSLRPGVRVRMSPLGLERHPKYGMREGLIVGRGSPSSWRVRFDERKTVQAIFQGYLELVSKPETIRPRVVDHDRPVKEA
jgi:hypothetical protein